MIKMASVTELREKLAETIASLDAENAVMVLRHSKPAAYLVSPRLFDELIERLEDLEDLQDMTAALVDYRQGSAVDAEDVFGRLGL
jgi:prevent-host-death family protein